MGHLVIESVGPQWWVAGRCRHGRVVNETEFFHHEELAVPSDAQERHTQTTYVLHMDASKTVDDVSLAHHFVEPVFNGGVVGPPVLRTTMSASTFLLE